MKNDRKQYLYSNEEPKGRIFEVGEEVPAGWVDTPTKIKATKPEKSNVVDIEEQTELEELRAAYFDKFGKKPFHLKKAASLREELDDRKYDNNSSTS